jgi:plastocyanin
MRLSLSLAILLAGFASGAVTAQGPSQSITVQLSSFKFTPATLTLMHGRPYVIHFTNTSSGGHDFVAKDFFAAATIAPEDRSKVAKGGVSLGGGESTDVHLVPNRPGTYKSHCSHFMHSGFGMKGQVVVE